MTPQEFADKMREIYPADDDYDEIESHMAADKLMLECLKEFGYEEGVQIFRGASRWYS